jgi:predicted ArsR family transcriptional regulator
LSTPDIARRLQVPERTIRYHLRQMTEGRVVEQEGTARKTRRYRLPLRQVGERQKDSDVGVTSAIEI